MRAMSARSFEIANEVNARSCVTPRTTVRRGEQSCVADRTAVRFTKALMQKAQMLFTGKTPAKQMAVRADCATRTAEYWKEGRPIAMEEFFKLLDSAEGTDFLNVFWEHVPAATAERWLHQKLLAKKLIDAEAKLAAGKKQAEQLRLQLKSS